MDTVQAAEHEEGQRDKKKKQKKKESRNELAVKFWTSVKSYSPERVGRIYSFSHTHVTAIMIQTLRYFFLVQKKLD